MLVVVIQVQNFLVKVLNEVLVARLVTNLSLVSLSSYTLLTQFPTHEKIVLTAPIGDLDLSSSSFLQTVVFAYIGKRIDGLLSDSLSIPVLTFRSLVLLGWTVLAEMI
jgi:sorbitol-specific phosphotransferase system component IIC